MEMPTAPPSRVAGHRPRPRAHTSNDEEGLKSTGSILIPDRYRAGGSGQ